MTTTAEDVLTTPRDRFGVARTRLAEARLRQREKDTPAHRASVAARLADVDAILDAHLSARRQQPGR
jgi:hypothetical protein